MDPFCWTRQFLIFSVTDASPLGSQEVSVDKKNANPFCPKINGRKCWNFCDALHNFLRGAVFLKLNRHERWGCT